MINKLLRFLFSVVGVFALVALLGAGAVFFRPELVLNPGFMNFALEKTGVLKEWSWDEAKLDHEWIAWNKRKFAADFKDLCFVYEKEETLVDTCLQNFSGAGILSWNLKDGFEFEATEPVNIQSREATIELAQKQEGKKKGGEEKESKPLDIKKYWDTLWSPSFPDANINFGEINLKRGGRERSFDLNIQKKDGQLKVVSGGFELSGNKKGLHLAGPKKIKLPLDSPLLEPLYLRDLKLDARMGKNWVFLEVEGNLQELPFSAQSKVPLPLPKDFTKPAFLKKVALNTKASLKVEELQELVNKILVEPFDSLPAPLNAMKGGLNVAALVSPAPRKDEVEIVIGTRVDLTGKKQELDFELVSKVAFNLRSFKPGPIFLDLDLEKVLLQLPQLPKNKLPPQLMPDPRIMPTTAKFHEQLAQKQVEEEPIDLNMSLQALEKESLAVRTNLLDELLRVNMHLLVEEGKVKKGFVKALPLRTTLFKREIALEELVFVFNHPKEPGINAEIKFLLPEYTITMHLEGPLSQVRHSFTSDPPLPQADIYAVLLFGRPMNDLDSGDRDAAARINQVLSQGLLSLSALYFFSGTPIEAIIYDSASQEVQAQFGLGSRSSLTVGGQSGGISSVGVRYSLGGGWHIDTSARRNENLDNTQSRDYGILLERIIAY